MDIKLEVDKLRGEYNEHRIAQDALDEAYYKARRPYVDKMREIDHKLWKLRNSCSPHNWVKVDDPYIISTCSICGANQTRMTS